jgi:hypothetical protein
MFTVFACVMVALNTVSSASSPPSTSVTESSVDYLALAGESASLRHSS